MHSLDVVVSVLGLLSLALTVLTEQPALLPPDRASRIRGGPCYGACGALRGGTRPTLAPRSTTRTFEVLSVLVAGWLRLLRSFGAAVPTFHSVGGAKGGDSAFLGAIEVFRLGGATSGLEPFGVLAITSCPLVGPIHAKGSRRIFSCVQSAGAGETRARIARWRDRAWSSGLAVPAGRFTAQWAKPAGRPNSSRPDRLSAAPCPMARVPRRASCL